MFKSPARIRIDYRGISDPDHPAVSASRLIAEVIGISNQVRLFATQYLGKLFTFRWEPV